MVYNGDMTYVVAVSGGVDSVVLLDMVMSGVIALEADAGDTGALRQLQGEEQSSELTSGDAAEGQAPPVIVAYFDHGMRSDSAADARFVEGLAQTYGVRYETRREELAGRSEEAARTRRYAFLDEVAAEHDGVVVTAHHADDVVETMALNIQRGTRWRGMACMDDERRLRPLQERTKNELIAYAVEQRLEWVEDATNRLDTYARNRVRKKLSALPSATHQALRNIRRDQLAKRREIDREISEGDFPVYERYFMTMISREVAYELLYVEFLRVYGVSLLADQLAYALLAIKTGRVRTRWQIGQGVELELLAKTWRVQMQEK